MKSSEKCGDVVKSQNAKSDIVQFESSILSFLPITNGKCQPEAGSVSDLSSDRHFPAPETGLETVFGVVEQTNMVSDLRAPSVLAASHGGSYFTVTSGG